MNSYCVIPSSKTFIINSHMFDVRLLR